MRKTDLPPFTEPLNGRHGRACFLAAIIPLTLALVLPVAARDGGEFSAEEVRRLETGDILTWTWSVAGRSVPWMKASGLVDAPPEAVWKIIDDCARYKDTMPRTADSEELERHDGHVLCRATADMPFPFSDLVTETDAVQTIEPGKLYRREWKQRSGAFAANEGRWTLEPWRDGPCTLATYEALTEPKTAIPDFILRFGTRRALPEMIAGLRTHAQRYRGEGDRGTAPVCQQRLGAEEQRPRVPSSSLPPAW